MDFAAMTREQIALLVAMIGVFGVIPIGWLIHGILKDKRDGALSSKGAKAAQGKTLMINPPIYIDAPLNVSFVKFVNSVKIKKVTTEIK